MKVLAVAFVVLLASCVRITVGTSARTDTNPCYPQPAPAPADSAACVRIAIGALAREIGDGYAYVAQFRTAPDSVLISLAGGPSPPWVGGGGLVTISRRSGARVIELYQ